jgi:glycosyltransferase involved in cell wall biosynthesis
VRKFVGHLARLGWTVHVVAVDDAHRDPAAPVDPTTLADVSAAKVTRTRTFPPAALTGAIRRASGTRADGSASGDAGLTTRAAAFVRSRIAPRLLSPDASVLWRPFALAAARPIVRDQGVRVILAVGPPFGVLSIGEKLARVTGLPLVVDLKDAWVGGGLWSLRPAPARARDARSEARLFAAAARVVVPTAEALALYRERYPDRADRLRLVPNGVDREDFADLPPDPKTFRVVVPGQLDFRRDPGPVVAAFRGLRDAGELGDAPELVFVGDVHPAFQGVARIALGASCVERGELNLPDYARALASAAALVLIPSADIPSAIPGKLYEMAAASRRTLVLAEGGATADLCRKAGWGTVADPRDPEAIAAFLRDAHRAHARGEAVHPAPDDLLRDHDRARLAESLAAILEDVAR